MDVKTEDRYLVGEARLQVELTDLDLQRPAAPSITPTTGLIPRRRLRMCRMRSQRHCSSSGHNDGDEMRDASVPRDRGGRRTRTPLRPSPRPGARNPWPAGSSASARMSRTVRGGPAALEGSACPPRLDGGRCRDTDDVADLGEMAVRLAPMTIGSPSSRSRTRVGFACPVQDVLIASAVLARWRRRSDRRGRLHVHVATSAAVGPSVPACPRLRRKTFFDRSGTFDRVGWTAHRGAAKMLGSQCPAGGGPFVE